MRSKLAIVLAMMTVLTFEGGQSQTLLEPGLLSSIQTHQNSDSIDSSFEGATAFAKPRRQKPISIATATTLAIFPGVIFHGIGHFYARDPKTGFVLLGIDLASKGVFFFEGLKGMSEGYKESSEAVLWACIGVNLAAWLYDIGHAGVAANNYNSRYQFSVKSYEGSLTVVLSVNIDR